jgi:hypothetical protein
MDIVIDAVTLGIAPAVAIKQFFKDRGRVKGLRQPDGALVDQLSDILHRLDEPSP